MAEISGEVKRELRTIMTKASTFLKWEAASRDTIDVKKIYIDIAGDLVSGIFLSQVIFYYLPSKNSTLPKVRVLKDGKMWIAKTRKDWWDECRVSPKQFDRCIYILGKEKGLIEHRIFKFYGSPTVHVSLNIDILIQMVNSILTKGEEPICPKGNNDIDQRGISLTKITSEITTEIEESRFSKNQLGREKEINPEPNHQQNYVIEKASINLDGIGYGETNDVFEQASRNVACIPAGGPDHMSVLAKKAMRLLGRLPRQVEEEATCKRCDGTRAITKKIRGMVYECACSCVANY
jgi:hypothetical protein